MHYTVQVKMWRNKPPSTRRADIQHLYDSYASGQATLLIAGLRSFLQIEQQELTANEEEAERLIDTYEIEETGE